MVAAMWWGIGGGMAILYLVLLIVLGISCLRKGHWVMFILGFFIPCSGSSARSSRRHARPY